MTKIKNKTVYSDDHTYLKYLAEELDFIGREYKLDLKNNSITQFALAQPKPKPVKVERKPRRND